MIERLKFERPPTVISEEDKDTHHQHSTAPTIIDILDGPFANWTEDHDDFAWRTFFKAIFALPMQENEFSLYQACTGRTAPPERPLREVWGIIGRRGGKSAAAAELAVYLGLWGGYEIKPGETVRILVLALTKAQAAIIKNYAQGILESHPALQRKISSSDQFSIQLATGVEIYCTPNSFRSVRGPTVVAAIFDELAFWFADGETQNPDIETLRAVRPAMATVKKPLLIGLSSPYARRGLLWDRYERYFGKDDERVLIWQAPTRVMNPSVPASVIEEALTDDPESAKAEFLAEFRTDIEAFLSIEAIADVTDEGIRVRKYDSEHQYVGFIDPAGGSGKDSMTLAIAHIEDGVVVLDLLREVKPRFSPQSVVAEFAEACRSYRINAVSGDRWGGQFVKEPFRRHGIQYRLCEKSKNELYRDLLSVINSKSCKLIDHPKLKAQLASLERRTGRQGKDVIDHPRSGFDDLANAAAGVIDLALSTSRRPRMRPALIAPKILTSGSHERVDLNGDPSLKTLHDYS